MKRCAICFKQYEADYDACPHCAKRKASSEKAAVGCMSVACGPIVIVWIIVVLVVGVGLIAAVMK